MPKVKLLDLGWCVARVVVSGAGSHLTLMQPADVADNVYSPAQSVTIYGEERVAALRDFLVAALPEKNGGA